MTMLETIINHPLGCDSVSDKIYGLHRDRNEWQLVDSMKTQCEWGSALNIPSSLVPWC